MNVYINICVSVGVYVHMYTDTYIYLHVYINTQTYIYQGAIRVVKEPEKRGNCEFQ